MNPARFLALETASEGTTVTAAVSLPVSREALIILPNAVKQAVVLRTDDLPSAWPPSATVPWTSRMSVNTTQTITTKANYKDIDPTAAGINVKAVHYSVHLFARCNSDNELSSLEL